MSIRLYEDPAHLAAAAAEHLLAAIRGGRGRLLLAGGTTPRLTYEALAGRTGVAERDALELFFGDERMVAPDHADSNYAMVRRAWLDPAAISCARVHRIAGERPAEEAAREAERALGDRAIDVALCGLGADGHTCSLFPGDPVLAERSRRFAPARSGARVSATYRLLDACGEVVFLVAGADKAEAVRRALLEPPGAVPASAVRPARPPLWLLDRAAASGLPRAIVRQDGAPG